MTLQFFKQIARTDCLRKDDTLDETLQPWGRVVYKIPGEGDEWLLAQRGGQLVRCSLPPEDWVARSEGRVVDTEHFIARHSSSSVEAMLAADKAALATAVKKEAAYRPLRALPQLFLA